MLALDGMTMANRLLKNYQSSYELKIDSSLIKEVECLSDGIYFTLVDGSRFIYESESYRVDKKEHRINNSLPCSIKWEMSREELNALIPENPTTFNLLTNDDFAKRFWHQVDIQTPSGMLPAEITVYGWDDVRVSLLYPEWRKP